MEPLNFIYWLQGYLELQDPKTISGPKVQMIKDHLGLVLNKVIPGQTPKLQGTNLILTGDGTWKSAKQIEAEGKDSYFSSIIKFPYQNPPASC